MSVSDSIANHVAGGGWWVALEPSAEDGRGFPVELISLLRRATMPQEVCAAVRTDSVFLLVRELRVIHRDVEVVVHNVVY